MAYYAIGHGNAVVIFTERRSLMHDARAIRVCDIGINNNSKRSILKLRLTLETSRAFHKDQPDL